MARLEKSSDKRSARLHDPTAESLPTEPTAAVEKVAYETKTHISQLRKQAKNLRDKTNLALNDKSLNDILNLQRSEIKALAKDLGAGYVSPSAACIVGNAAILHAATQYYTQKWLLDPENQELARTIAKLAGDHAKLEVAAHELVIRTSKAIEKQKAKEELLNPFANMNRELAGEAEVYSPNADVAKCSMCKQYKLPEQFYADRTRANGVSSRCKDCTKLYFNEKPSNKRSIKEQNDKSNKECEVSSGENPFIESSVVTGEDNGDFDSYTADER